jgi:hypothetical protein
LAFQCRLRQRAHPHGSFADLEWMTPVTAKCLIVGAMLWRLACHEITRHLLRLALLAAR